MKTNTVKCCKNWLLLIFDGSGCPIPPKSQIKNGHLRVPLNPEFCLQGGTFFGFFVRICAEAIFSEMSGLRGVWSGRRGVKANTGLKRRSIDEFARKSFSCLARFKRGLRCGDFWPFFDVFRLFRAFRVIFGYFWPFEGWINVFRDPPVSAIVRMTFRWCWSMFRQFLPIRTDPHQKSEKCPPLEKKFWFEGDP